MACTLSSGIYDTFCALSRISMFASRVSAVADPRLLSRVLSALFKFASGSGLASPLLASSFASWRCLGAASPLRGWVSFSSFGLACSSFFLLAGFACLLSGSGSAPLGFGVLCTVTPFAHYFA